MLNSFSRALASNLAFVLTAALVAGAVAGGWLYVRARKRHVDRIRRRLGAHVPVPRGIKDTLAKALNADAAEIGAIGAVTFVDLAWQYSMADPTIWDHFHGPAATHITDAIQNLDVLKGTLGDHALPVVDNVFEYLRHLEALHVFGDLIDKLPVVGASTQVVLEAKGASVVDTLIKTAITPDAATTAGTDVAALGLHIPVVTVGFAAYRAWRRSQKGAGLRRNVEFATIEVATRATGGLVGGQVGGVIGTAIVPGVGTAVGAVAGAVAGALGGAVLGETIKKRHVERAGSDLNASLERLGATYLEDDANFAKVTGVFREQESEYLDHLGDMRRRLRRYAMPWRLAWPDEKLILLEETVHLAEERLSGIQQGTVDAIDRLAWMRASGQRRELGVMLWSNPALAEEVPCDVELVGAVRSANDRLRHEMQQFGVPLPEAMGA